MNSFSVATVAFPTEAAHATVFQARDATGQRKLTLAFKAVD